MRRLAAFSFLFLPLATCLEATEVRVVVWTDICDTLDVSVAIDDKPASAQAKFPAKCGDLHRLGEIVLVPTAVKPFTVHVRGAGSGGSCETKMNCVEANRSVAYLQHRSLELRVDLTSDCIGVNCPQGQTCVHHMCVDDRIDCPACSDAGRDALDVIDAPFDAPLEVSTLDAPIIDAAPLCKLPDQLLFKGLSPLYRWTFDEANAVVIEANNSTSVPFGMGSSHTQGPVGCGTAITYNEQPLAVTYTQTGLGLAAWVLGGKNQVLFTKRSTIDSKPNILILIDPNQNLWIETFDGLASDAIFPPVPQKWFALEVKLASGQIAVAYDGVSQAASQTNIRQGAFIKGTLWLGNQNGTPTMDELRIYPLTW